MASITRQSDVVTQDDVAFDDMAMEKYHFKDQELSLDELYLAMKISPGEQVSHDLMEAKLNVETSIFSQRINLGNQLLGGQVYNEALSGERSNEDTSYERQEQAS